MYGIDVVIISAAAAAVFWGIVSLYLQIRWRVYDLFVSKKRGIWAHGALMVLTTLQLVAFSAIDVKSGWVFPTFWLLGAPVLIASGWLFWQAVREAGAGSIFNAAIFKHKHPKNKGPIWHKYKQPLYISYVGAYLGLGLTTGRIGFLLTALVLAVGLGLLTYLTGE